MMNNQQSRDVTMWLHTYDLARQELLDAGVDMDARARADRPDEWIRTVPHDVLTDLDHALIALWNLMQTMDVKVDLETALVYARLHDTVEAEWTRREDQEVSCRSPRS